MREKNIKFTFNYISNYIFHIFALAKIGYYSEYAERYSSFIKKEDLKYLEDTKSFLMFGDGKTGPFTAYFLFLPIYLDIKSKEEFENYFNLLTKSFKENDFDNFLNSYNFDWDDPFISMSFGLLKIKLSKQEWEKIIKPYIGDFETLSKIFINNYDKYEPLWKKIEPLLSEKSRKLNFLINNIDYKSSKIKGYNNQNISLIERWENITGKTFKSKNYYILLCYANKNGPDANSISYNKNIFYYGSNEKYIIDFVSHEIGTHLFIDLIYKNKDLFNNAGYTLNFELVYAAFENLARFYNIKVLERKDLNYTLNFKYKSDIFMEIFEKYYKPGIKSETLFKAALEYFS